MARWDGALAALATLILGACGGGDPTAKEVDGTASPSVQRVEVTGKYYAHDWDDVCSSYTDVVSNKAVTFKDGSGAVIGTTETGKLTDVLNDVGGTGGPAPEMGVYSSCEEWASYEVSLPKTDFYQAEIEGEAVGTISYENLEAKDFQFKLVSSDKGSG